MEWVSGPDAVARARAWCDAHSVTLTQLGAACTPPIYRSAFKRWHEGDQPRRDVWLRLVDAMEHYEERSLDRLLEG